MRVAALSSGAPGKRGGCLIGMGTREGTRGI